MDLNFHWINLLILFGALQGLIFGLILVFNKKHPGAIFLAVFMFVLAYNGFETFNWSAGLDRYNIFFDLFSFIVIFAIGPAIYLYINSLLYPERKFPRRKIGMHFGWVFFQFAVRLGIIAYHILWINKVFDSDLTSMKLNHWYGAYAEPLSVVVFLGYLAASIREFQVTQQIRSVSKDGQRIVYNWIKALLFCMIILGVAWPLTVLTPYFFHIETDDYYYPIELAVVLFIYWIAMTGYHRTRMIYLKPSRTSVNSFAALSPEKHLCQLRHAMEHHKLYLDPELNLNKVAAHTGIAPKTISTILNQYHHTSFNDFINHYRVCAVRERLGDPSFQHLTISGIALDSGFNSQATFQRAFKSNTGMTPREYMTMELKKTA